METKVAEDIMPLKIIPRDDCPYSEIQDFSALDTFSKQRSAWRQYLMMMQALRLTHYVGWIAWIDSGNIRLRRFLQKIGAREYAKGSGKIFVKCFKEGINGRVNPSRSTTAHG